MAQRLKSWESPRRQGRNSKGKGGSARQRQLKKQRQMLRKKLKGETPNQHQHHQYNQNQEKRTEVLFSFYLQVRRVRSRGEWPFAPEGALRGS
jgi:hypothetical protein